MEYPNEYFCELIIEANISPKHKMGAKKKDYALYL